MKSLKHGIWTSGAVIAVAAIVAACNGSSGAGVTPTTATVTTASHDTVATVEAATAISAKGKKRGRARFIIHIPRKEKRGRHLHPEYISPSTKSMTIAVENAATQIFNLTPTSPNCTSDPSTGYLTCTAAITIGSKWQTITVTLYNQQKAQGQSLATATISWYISPTGFTDIPITLGGIPVNAQVLVDGTAATTVPVGVPTTIPVTVQAYDASGNLIIPPGNYTTPITVSDTDAGGFTTFPTPTPASFSAPGTTALLSYTGGADLITNPQVTPPTLAASISGVPLSGSTATLNITGAAIFGTHYETPTSGSEPYDITVGPDGTLWFVEYGSGKIGQLIAGSGAITEYSIPSASSRPYGITVGPDGALWFTEEAKAKVGRITTNGTITEYSLPTASYQPYKITAGPDGALWFTDRGTNSIGRITTTGAVTEYSIPTSGSEPLGITAGPDNALWFGEALIAANGKIGRITTGGVITEYPVPALSAGAIQLYSNSNDIAVGPDGALWFTDSCNEAASKAGLGGTIGRITTNGTVTEYPLTLGGIPLGITTGPDGALWFAFSSSATVGRITTNGIQAEYRFPTSTKGGEGYAITSGRNGALWIADESASAIDSVFPPSPAPSSSPEARRPRKK